MLYPYDVACTALPWCYAARHSRRSPLSSTVTRFAGYHGNATAITWIYADRIDKTPQRCYAVNNRSHFAFSDVRKLITRDAFDKDFVTFCPKPARPGQNSLIKALLRMVA
ncbi:hypothetical protein [Nitrosomonas sp. Nm51]|uniref:hypothetical protein n=1 Tax=Nitrosomonas sp. Nm51 TaxID=133720 RepID=UPI001C430413|nr:hypothetical protein [Nitrosomonas sp. Nm51]